MVVAQEPEVGEEDGAELKLVAMPAVSPIAAVATTKTRSKRGLDSQPGVGAKPRRAEAVRSSMRIAPRVETLLITQMNNRNEPLANALRAACNDESLCRRSLGNAHGASGSRRSAGTQASPRVEDRGSALGVLVVALRLGLTSFGGAVTHVATSTASASNAAAGSARRPVRRWWRCRRRSLAG